MLIFDYLNEFIYMIFGGFFSYVVLFKFKGNEILALKNLFELKIIQLEEKIVYLQLELEKFEKNLFESHNSCSVKNEEIIRLNSEISNLRENLAIIPVLKSEIRQHLDFRDRIIKINIDLEKQTSKLTVLLENEHIQCVDKIDLLNITKKKMFEEIRDIAGLVFREEGDKFINQNNLQVSNLVNPIKEQIVEFKKKIEDIYDKESREKFSLLNEIGNLKDLNVSIGREALNLTKALKGDVRVQGSWGEVMLERILENSGLQKDHFYDVQVVMKKSNGEKYKPDVVIKLPGGRSVVVDAKVSLKSYERCCSEKDNIKRELFLKEHVVSVKSHIKKLSLKSYEDLNGIQSLDFVLMFVPIEEAFFAVIRYDQTVILNALEDNVFIVSPSTLLLVLRTINNLWRNEDRHRNSIEIARQAGKLYDKVVTFASSIEDIGKHLEKAKNSYTIAVNRLSTGKGNLIKRAQFLKMLGLKTKKTMPELFINHKNDELSNYDNES